MKKRFSKKALSLFLAVMMIITAVPAFSLTVSAAGTEAEKKEIISETLKTTVDSAAPQSSDASVTSAYDGSYSKSDLTFGDELSNVLYTYGCSSNAAYNNEDNNSFRAGLQFGTITFLYDGANTMACPIQAYGGDCKWNRYSMKLVSAYIEAKDTETETMTLKHYWHGSQSTTPGYQSGTSVYANIVASKTDPDDGYSLMDGISWGPKVYYFSNTLYYNCTISDTTTHKISSGISDSFYANYSDSHKTSCSFAVDGTAYNSRYAAIYVLNYKPMYDLLNGTMKTQFKNVYDNSWKYTKSSLEAYKTAVNNVLDFDLTSYNKNNSTYFSSSSNVETVGNEIQKLVNAYNTAYNALTLDTFTVTINDSSVDITAGQTVGDTGLTIPTKGHDLSTHYTTTWSTDVPEKDTVPHEDVTYAYTTTAPAFTYNSSDKQFKCSCGSTISDASAYNAAAEKYATIDKSAYTSDGQTAITSAYSDFEAIKSNTYTTEDDVTSALNTQTANLLNAIGDQDGNKNTFTLTVNTYTDSTSTTPSTKGPEKHTYGYTESITIPSNAVSVKVTRDDGSKSGSSSTYIDFTPGENYTVKVQSNTVVDIYTADSASYVLLEDYAGRAQVIFTKAETATISDRTVTIDGTAYTTPSAGYVTFGGYTVDGTKATGSVKISSGSVIKAYGTKDTNTVTYNVSGGTINNEKELTAKVDTSLTIKATSENCSAIAIAIKNSDSTSYTAIAYGTTATFYGFPQAAVGDTVEIVCVDADDLSKYGLSDKMPMSYGVGYATAGSPNVFSMYCLMSTGSYDKTATIVERGVLVSATVSESDSLIKGADNVKTLKSSSDIDSQSYMATIKTSTSSTIYARSYVAYTVTYENDGTTYYLPVVAYGEVQTLTAA